MHRCAFDPVADELYCGTAAGEIVKVDTDRAVAVQRWKVTDGKVVSLSFLTHRHSNRLGGGVRGLGRALS